jgi:hypothetical protein
MARLVLLTIPTGKREAVFDVLTDEEIDYVVSEETSGRDYVLSTFRFQRMPLTTYLPGFGR